MKTKQHIWTDEEKDYLKEITYGRHYKEIVELMNSKFEYEFREKQIASAIKRYGLNTGFTGRFEKGCTPAWKGTKGLMKANKTSFKKGNIPKNHRPLGSERITVDGYIEIKVEEPNIWMLKQRYVWEKENGPIPEGYRIIFADKNKLNTSIDNLRLISSQQLLVLNNNNLIKEDPDLTEAGIKIANIILKISELEKDRRLK